MDEFSENFQTAFDPPRFGNNVGKTSMIINDNVAVFQWHVFYYRDSGHRSICGGGTAVCGGGTVGIHLFAGVALQTERYHLFNKGDLHCS